MDIFNFLGSAAMFLDALSGPSGKKYDVSCESFELFEKGTTWRGTARVHGAGAHLETIMVNANTTLFLPDRSDNSQYTPRGLLRKSLREWAGQQFAFLGTISKDMVVLNEGENCLSIEGFVKKVNDKWKLVNDAGKGTHYGAYKLCLTEKNGSVIGYEELYHLFKADTIGRVSSVDVHDGF